MKEKTKTALNITKWISIILILLGGLVSMVSWKNEVDYIIDYNTAVNIEQQECIEKIELKQIEEYNILVEIKTNVEWLIENARGK